MAGNQPIFAYTNEQLDGLVQTLSTDRIGPYLHLSQGDRKYAVKLYEWNTALSESFYGVLQGLEVALRNSFHRVLSLEHNREDWYDVPNLLHEAQMESVQKARARIIQDGKVVAPGRVVAELTFGFWVALTGPGYAQGLWDQCLHRALVARLGRKATHRRLEGIRKLRNRVAHHESIIGRNLENDFARIMETIHWICPVTAAWIRCNSSFHPRYKARPKPPEPPELIALTDGAPISRK